MYSSELCEEQFDTKEELKRHLENDHKEKNSGESNLDIILPKGW